MSRRVANRDVFYRRHLKIQNSFKINLYSYLRFKSICQKSLGQNVLQHNFMTFLQSLTITEAEMFAEHSRKNMMQQ